MNGPGFSPPGLPGPPLPGPPAERPQAPGAVAAIVLGILSIVLLPLFGPVAWAVGRSAEQAADAAGGELGGRGLATAGKILGMIGTAFLLLLIAALVALLLTSGGSGGSSGPIEA